MEWRLRRAVEADAAALSLVAAATFLEAYSGFLPRDDMLAHLAGRSSPANFRDWIGDFRSIVTIAEAPLGQAPLGYAVLTAPDLPIEPRAGDLELRRIYALATSWGSGLGAAMMERAIEDARAAACGRILLGTHPDNHRAHRFYEKYGFALIGRRTFRVGESAFDDPIFGLTL